jgi:predicted O-linked N-acetylglucosamine transferase (SPINDLY family)
VGWIARWLFVHHDHDRFEIYTYFNQQVELQEFSHQWFVSRSDQWRALSGNLIDIARTIQTDEIDILVDVDSFTWSETYGVMALKPAPVQVTWLGWDASGLSNIDYFLADPYVLPENAQDYYTEKIWRLPQTYVAVQGFEVDFPSRRREDLDIPAEAIVYLSNQTVLKRQPDSVRLQMRVLRQVPDSYLLLRTWGTPEAAKSFFGEMAELEGVSRDRLRFLPRSPSESLARGNLALADIVLDSYPYSGATTTLETLWVGLPVVTRVGKQFAARNSYTMMMNAGITEGIAWSDEEYIDWAVKLGSSEELRQQVFTKLMRSRQTSPLWNPRQFARDLEAAYERMWEMYCQSQNNQSRDGLGGRE